MKYIVGKHVTNVLMNWHVRFILYKDPAYSNNIMNILNCFIYLLSNDDAISKTVQYYVQYYTQECIIQQNNCTNLH